MRDMIEDWERVPPKTKEKPCNEVQESSNTDNTNSQLDWNEEEEAELLTFVDILQEIQYQRHFELH